MNIFVGNLNFKTTEEQLQELFAAHGNVASVKIVTDRETGRSRGFAFVEMPNDDEAQKAIDALNQQEFLNFKINVNEARERAPRREGGGGGGYRGGGGGGYRGGNGGGGYGGGNRY